MSDNFPIVLQQDSGMDNVPRGFIPLHEALARAERLRRDGRLADAETLCRRVLEARANSYEAEHLLGIIAHQRGDLAGAIAHIERAVTLAPQIPLLQANLSEMYRLAGRTDEAVAAAQRALALNPRFPEPLNNLARIAVTRGEAQQALDYCRRALALKPDFADAYNNLGNILKELGEVEEARRAYLKALELAPGIVGVYVNLAEVHHFTPGDPQLAALEALAAKPEELSETDRLYIDFTLGKAYDDLKDYRRSFARLLSGNAAKRAQVNYDEKSSLGLFDRIESVFTPELIAAKSGGGDPSRVPVFIVGMPRSGTTLVEQILASHPQVHGAGELNTLFETITTVRGPDGGPVAGPKSVPGLDAATFAAIGARYVAGVRKLAPAAARVTDKMPYNFYFIGLIHLTLPNARIIHVMRDPADTCVSCFSKLFTVAERGELNHTYDLGELGRYYRRYERLMGHWRRVLPPGRILDVRYEDVVADLEGEARRMLAYCDLAWDERCVAFHQTRRHVRTASATQVRQPIYRSAIGRWRAYEEFIGPLLAELDGPRDETGRS